MTATITELRPDTRAANPTIGSNSPMSDVELLSQIENWANARKQILDATKTPLNPGVREKAERILAFIHS